MSFYSDSNFTTITAGEDLSSSVGRGVVSAGTLSADNTTSIIAGVVVRGAASGLPVIIQGSGYGKMRANAAITTGTVIGTTTSGNFDDQGVGVSTYYAGVALEAASAQEHLIKALISIGATGAGS